MCTRVRRYSQRRSWLHIYTLLNMQGSICNAGLGDPTRWAALHGRSATGATAAGYEYASAMLI